MTARVVGRYEILRLLGRGGMASVHLARQPALDRQVALKELHPARASDATFARRFLHESRVGGALNHPNVVSVIEYFEHEGVPFIAMEYLERGSLRPLVGRLTLAQVAGVMESVLAGLTEAAAQGIVHRDLKPENVLVTADGHAKVGDFGIAKALGEVCMTSFRTATGQIVGTAAYMAPEQVTGADITVQADLYAAGLIAYELLAGRHPFHDTDAPMALVMRQVSDDPPPLAGIRPDLPPGVVAWIHAMLAKDPAARPAGAAHAWDRLEGVVADELGPRWRRAAILPEPGEAVAPAAEVAPPRSDPSGIYSVVLPSLDLEPTTADTEPTPIPAAAPEPISEPDPVPPPAHMPDPVPLPAPMPDPVPPPAASEPLPIPPTASDPGPEAPAEDPSAAPAAPTARRVRRRALLAAAAAVLVFAVAGFMYASAPEEAPHAAAPAPPKGPSLVERVRDVVVPALRANARVSRQLAALDPGDDPDQARRRVDSALPVTAQALNRAADLPARPVRSALRAQGGYLRAVRAALALEPGDHELATLSSRLVVRLERIEALVPGASASVTGAAQLEQWALAHQLPALTPPPPPAAVASPHPAPPAPTPVATPTPTPTATPTPEPVLVDPHAEPGAVGSAPSWPRRRFSPRRRAASS